MHDLLLAIKTALRAIPGVKTVTTIWPKAFDTLPCVLVQLAGETPEDCRDDVEYLTTVEWYVRVFCGTETAQINTCAAVKEAMEGLGYRRTFRFDDGGAEVWQTTFRFQRTI